MSHTKSVPRVGRRINTVLHVISERRFAFRRNRLGRCERGEHRLCDGELYGVRPGGERRKLARKRAISERSATAGLVSSGAGEAAIFASSPASRGISLNLVTGNQTV